MARIKELHGSRIGETRGLDGATGTNRIFQVIAEPEDIVVRPDGFSGFLDPLLPDPFFLLTDVPSGGLASLKIDSVYPWDETQTVRNYTVLDSPSPGHWIIRVDYGRPVSIALPGSGSLWSISLRGVTVSLERIQEYELNISAVEGKSRRGVPLDEIEATLPGAHAADNRLLGAVVFEEFTPEEGQEASANFEGGGVFLRATKDRLDRRINADVPALSVTFTRLAENFSISRNGVFLALFMQSVNKVRFQGAPAGHVLCTDISVDPVAGDFPGQKQPGIAYRISVSFLWSAERWSPEGRVATFRNKAGSLRVVHWNKSSSQHFANNGDEVIENFRVKRSKDLNELLVKLQRS